uniref:Uncharacterized protein n=1 Tax=Globisporangium ultimum (strain ATCC 200006 / CBS 805.95 / DAOM BR144) TaxID=431595 RepID=K3X999_GLOUD
MMILRSIYVLRRFAYYRSHRKLVFSHVVRCAIWYKRWEILQWLGCMLPRDPMWPCEPDVMAYAVEQRDFTLMCWVYDTFPDACLTLSARRIEVRESGNLALVKWLHEHDYAFSVWMMNGAAARGNLDVVRFLHDHRTEGCTTVAMDLAARFGHLDVVQFLHANRTEGCTEQALDGAAKYGRRNVVQFLLENRSEGRAVSALKTAMIYNQQEIVRILQEFLAVWGHERSIHAV